MACGTSTPCEERWFVCHGRPARPGPAATACSSFRSYRGWENERGRIVTGETYYRKEAVG